jgi:FixJ family two-component response regulator
MVLPSAFGLQPKHLFWRLFMTGRALRVLVIEDSEDDLRLLLRALRHGGYAPEFERVETAAAMRTALAEKEWDIIISDHTLPEFSGLAALEVLKESGLDLPFILVSGIVGEEMAVRAMKAGAHDFIMKENYARLEPAIERELREVTVRRERRQAEENLRRAHEELEVRVRERTAELNSANETLRASRVAALNLMEDAVIARREAEETSDRLRIEIAERERAEEELRASNEELTRFNSAAVDRELRMIELKEEVNELCGRVGEEPRYPLEFERDYEL